METLLFFGIFYLVVLVKYIWDETIVDQEEEMTDEEINEILFL